MITEEQDILTSISESQTKEERPVVITILCVLGFLGACFSIPLLFTRGAILIGDWYPLYLGISAVIVIICFIGLWKMKKWGAYAYIGLTVVDQIFLLMMGIWTIFSLVIPAAVVGILLYHLYKMD